MYVKVQACSQESHVLVGKCTVFFLWQNEGYILIYQPMKASDNEPPVLTVWGLYFYPHDVSVGEIRVSLKSDENNV